MIANTAREMASFNSAMLRWAREWRAISIEEAAKKIGKTPEDIQAWEENTKKPTVRQARQLSDFYRRPFLEFFLPKPPEIFVPKSVPDFRTHRGIDTPIENRLVGDIHRWSETQKINAIDLFSEIGERPPEIPSSIFFDLSTSPDIAAKKARDAIGFSFEDQISLKKTDIHKLPEIIRGKFESIGILTLKRSDLGQAGVRGMCIAELPLPVIVISNESPSAQAYTLAHEFAHVLLQESGITGKNPADYSSQPIERWCDRFAASFLMPNVYLENVIGKSAGEPADSIDDAYLLEIASKFRVSPHAMLIRLVHLGYVKPSYYWEVKRPQFEEEEKNYSGFGRSKYYGTRYKSSLGNLYTGLVLEAWDTGRITNHNAAEFMGIKNISHLMDIKNNFGSAA